MCCDHIGCIPHRPDDFAEQQCVFFVKIEQNGAKRAALSLISNNIVKSMRILIILFLCVLTRQDGLSINSTLNDTLSFLSSKSYQLVVPVSNMTTYVKVSTASSSILSSPSVSLTGTSVQTCLRQTSKTVCSVGPLKNEETYKLSVTCFLSCEYSVEIYMDPTYKITLDERIEVASKEIEQHF